MELPGRSVQAHPPTGDLTTIEVRISLLVRGLVELFSRRDIGSE